MSTGDYLKCSVNVDELALLVSNLEARGFVPNDQFSVRSRIANHAIAVRDAKAWDSDAGLFIHNEQRERVLRE